MRLLRLSIYFLGLLAALMLSAFLFAVVSNAQTLATETKTRHATSSWRSSGYITRAGRVGGYAPSKAAAEC